MYKRFGQSPSSVQKIPLWQVGIRHTKNLTVNVRLHVTRARVKHSYEIEMCKGPGKRGHIVAYTLPPMMFLGLRKLGNIC